MFGLRTTIVVRLDLGSMTIQHLTFYLDARTVGNGGMTENTLMALAQLALFGYRRQSCSGSGGSNFMIYRKKCLIIGGVSGSARLLSSASFACDADMFAAASMEIAHMEVKGQ